MNEWLHIQRDFPASVEELFQFFVNPEKLVRWLHPDDCEPLEAKLEPVIGGLFYVDMRPLQQPAEVVSVRGRVLAVDWNRSLRFSWKWISGPLKEAPESVVELEFLPTPKGAVLRISQGSFSNEDMKAIHASGWKMALDGLLLDLQP
ncbi:MAG: hypothetical protein CMN76_19285 [Spirochaetaceae bacterium]|nr:hypothetical protein [Spirochaetaceae bacterium]